MYRNDNSLPEGWYRLNGTTIRKKDYTVYLHLSSWWLCLDTGYNVKQLGAYESMDSAIKEAEKRMENGG